MLEAADKPFDFKWPQPDRLRAGGSLLQLRGVGYTYSGADAPVLHVSSRIYVVTNHLQLPVLVLGSLKL